MISYLSYIEIKNLDDINGMIILIKRDEKIIC